MTFNQIKLYGIKQCDTMKKAQLWLKEQNIEFTFHDYRKDGLDEGFLSEQLDALGWEALLNKKGTTWRQLSDEIKNSITSNQTALPVLHANPAMIKRPLLIVAPKDQPNNALRELGFSAESYSKFFEALK